LGGAALLGSGHRTNHPKSQCSRCNCTKNASHEVLPVSPSRESPPDSDGSKNASTISIGSETCSITTSWCARAASGHVTAAPASSVMKSRLLIQSPRRHGQAKSAVLRGRAFSMDYRWVRVHVAPNSGADHSDQAAVKNCINYSSEEQPGHDPDRQCQIEAQHPFEQCEITLELDYAILEGLPPLRSRPSHPLKGFGLHPQTSSRSIAPRP
jgi:hypothetical protein